MPRLVLALDTSVAIFLDRLGYSERLCHIANILLAPAVVRELMEDQEELSRWSPLSH